MNLLQLYDTSNDFREYVDKYRMHYLNNPPISPQEAMTHKIVQQVADYMESTYDGKDNSITVKS